MEDPKIQEIRDSFDELFLWTSNEITDKSKQLFENLGIEWFAEIIARTKKYWFNASRKVLQDLVKVSFVIYSNLDKIPIQKKVILPKENWSYKFIITTLQHKMLRWAVDPNFQDIDTNTLILVSTWDWAHAEIAAKLWLKWKYSWEFNILWWAWIDIDYDKKALNIRADSGSYGSCSNQIVEWMLEEYAKNWYRINTDMDHQREFFDQKY